MIARDMAVTMARLDGQVLPTLVVFAAPTDATLLGVVTLEEFGLGIDPINQKLMRVRGLAMASQPLP